jgi:ABC-type transporter Mla subunit MlaD
VAGGRVLWHGGLSESAMGLPSANETLRKAVDPLREAISNLAAAVKDLKSPMGAVQCVISDTEARGEAIANVTLAYRHLEDARARLDKIRL